VLGLQQEDLEFENYGERNMKEKQNMIHEKSKERERPLSITLSRIHKCLEFLEKKGKEAAC
jgi:hypothetical protein